MLVSCLCAPLPSLINRRIVPSPLGHRQAPQARGSQLQLAPCRLQAPPGVLEKVDGAPQSRWDPRRAPLGGIGHWRRQRRREQQ